LPGRHAPEVGDRVAEHPEPGDEGSPEALAAAQAERGEEQRGDRSEELERYPDAWGGNGAPGDRPGEEPAGREEVEDGFCGDRGGEAGVGRGRDRVPGERQPQQLPASPRRNRVDARAGCVGEADLALADVLGGVRGSGDGPPGVGADDHVGHV
jgi:hypothetical protein